MTEAKPVPADFPAMPKGAFAIVFSVSLVTAIGNTGMQSVLPAIGREIGIPDAMVAAIFSLSALLWAAGSPFWADRSDHHGRKPLILVGLAGFAISMLACAIVVGAGVRHLLPPLVVFIAFLLARAVFGLFGSAAPPASQAYLADRTSREKRTGAIAAIAGAFGLGTIIGPAVAPLFVLPVIGLAGPMLAFSLIATGVLIWVARGLSETRKPFAESSEEVAVRPFKRRKPLWRDPRVAPFLIYGFLVSMCQTVQYQTLGFMVIDQLNLPPMQAQGYTSMAMMAGAVAGLLAQWGLIRFFAMSPRHLLRWGAILAAGANLLTAFAPTYVFVVIGFAISSLGYGFARPGYSAGASLAVSQEEQARAAGAVAVVNGLNVVIAPLFVILYQLYRPGPYLLNVVILAGLVAYALMDKHLKGAAIEPTTQEETARSGLNRNSAGGGF